MTALRKKSPSREASTHQQRLAFLERELEWTRFAFELEQELGEIVELAPLFQRFSDLLKKQLPYDYLEISLFSPFAGNDAAGDPSSDWVRNDTGYGGKLLTLILTPEFLRSLPRRHKPVLLDRASAARLVENTELLRIMALRSGILIPLRLDNRSCGLLKVLHCRDYPYPVELQKWVITCSAVLVRCLRRAHEFQKAQKLATIDGLSGLYNHRYFMEQLNREFQRSRRYEKWFCLILIDIDYFKQYNDTNGHLAGDRVLINVAQTIRQNVREIDLIARWGGDEFALLLPEISGENGMIVAEKIRREVEIRRFKNERQQPRQKLTVSLGVAENSPHLKNHREMFKLADMALYRAKSEGRNRCTVAK